MPHKNDEDRRAYAAAYRAANKERVKEYQAAYIQRHPDRRAASVAKANAKRRLVEKKSPPKQRGPQPKNYEGVKFGRLTVLAFAGKVKSCRTWRVLCECGNEKVVAQQAIVSGVVQSCGCLQKEVAARTGRASATHGQSGSPTYLSWCAMHLRCKHPSQESYKYYGGRGISVCERWACFENFLVDMGMRPEGKTLDRKDVNGNYEPGNCRWATGTEQAANRRPRGSA